VQIKLVTCRQCGARNESPTETEPSVECQHSECEEGYLPLNMVRLYRSAPICDFCYEEEYRGEGDPSWWDLPEYLPIENMR